MKQLVLIGGQSAFAKYIVEQFSGFYKIITMGRNNCDIYCDLSTNEPEDIRIPENTDFVINLVSNLNRSIDNILEIEKVNALGPLKVCMASNKANVKRIILISSIYASLDINSSYYSGYNISKKHGDELAEYYCLQQRINLTILRPSQFYDEKECFIKSQPLLYAIANNAFKNRDIEIYGKNDALRNYIHVRDLLSILEKVINYNITGIHGVCFRQNYRLSEIAGAAIEAFNSKSKIIFLKDKPNIEDNIFKEDFSLYEKIKYYPKIDIKSGMELIAKYKIYASS